MDAEKRSGDAETIPEPVQSFEGTDLPCDEIFDVLSNQRRRYALHYLRQIDGAVSLGILSEQVAAWETDQPVEEVTKNERKRVYTSLQQFHLPKMDEQGFVNYDQSSAVVELGEQAPDLELRVRATGTDDEPLPWHVFYLALAGLDLVFVALSLGGAPLFGQIPDTVVIVGLVGTLLCLALVHAITVRKR